MPRLDDCDDSFADASTKTILEKAKEVVNREVEKSTVFNSSVEEEIPRFNVNDIKLGRVVGRGGFCVVREVTDIVIRPDSNGITTDGFREKEPTRRRWRKRNGGARSSSFDSRHKSLASSIDTTEVVGSRGVTARRMWSKQSSKHYVVKQVNPDFMDTDNVRFLKGVIDLALECKFLASLNHPHILKLRGECCKSPFECTDFFLVIDFLPETLPRRLNAWMHRKRSTKGVTGLVTGSKRKVVDLMTERLLVAFDIASAGNYLHSKHIVFRDLKPDNVGFDANGVTKLMDFGLAKELTNEETNENGLYHLTGLTGGIRYMAPEVGLGLPYNLKADIYSWSMVMWYIMALEPPMGLYTPKMFIDRVFQRGYRPAIKEKWSPTLSSLIRSSWSEDLFVRPSFQEIMTALRNEVQEENPQVASRMKPVSEHELVSDRVH
jgi:serine/threonine protein kinase